MKDPLISVAMGVKYNSENTAYLKRSISSLLNQTFEDFELLICRRNCSPNAEKFLAEIVERDKRVILLDGSETNHLGGQLNLCIKHARGDFIARMDDDDFSYPERFSVQLKYLQKHSDIAFVGSCVRLLQNGEYVGKRELPLNPKVRDFLFLQPFIHPSIMFRKNCLEAVGGYSDAACRRGCEDYDLLLRLYEAGYYGANSEQILLDYSLSSSKNSHRYFSLRVNEMKTRFELFSRLKLLPKALPYVIKPVAVGLVPSFIIEWLKWIRMKNKPDALVFFKKKAASMIYTAIIRLNTVKKTKVFCPKTIAVVFTGALGDFLVMCAAAAALCDSGRKLTLICREGFGIEEAARLTGLFSEIISLKNKPAGRLMNILRLNKVAVETVFPAPLNRHPLTDIYTLSVKAARHILPDTPIDIMTEKLKQRADKMADELVPITESSEIKRYGELLYLSGLYAKEIKSYRFSGNALEPLNIAVVFPGAGCAEKRLSEKIWAEALKALHLRYGCRILIMGGNSDTENSQKLADQLSDYPTKNLCGKCSIGSTIKIVRHCRIVLANDSGGAHIGITCGTPTVVACGMWQYGRFFPCDADNAAAVFGDFSEECVSCGKSIPDCMGKRGTAPCVSAIKSEDIIRRASEFMNTK